MKSAWLVSTRLYCLFETSQRTKVTEDMFMQDSKRVLQRLKKAISFATNNRIPLRISNLNQKFLRVLGFPDASFANNADLCTQFRHGCFIGDDTGSVVPISFKSHKSRRVTTSAMAGELIFFSDLFDVAAALTSDIHAFIGFKAPVQLLTDSESLFNVI